MTLTGKKINDRNAFLSNLKLGFISDFEIRISDFRRKEAIWHELYAAD